jgi:hypothetical protein
VTHRHNRTPWRRPSSGKAQNCSHFLELPSNAVFCRAFGGGGGYNSRVRHDCGPTRSAMGEPSIGTPPSDRPLEDRLDSWKEITAYLKRDMTTDQRWEKREGMPVHRHQHDRMGSVYASRATGLSSMGARRPIDHRGGQRSRHPTLLPRADRRSLPSSIYPGVLSRSRVGA